MSSSFFHLFLSFMSLSFFVDFPLITSLMLFTTLMYLFSTPHGDLELCFVLHSWQDLSHHLLKLFMFKNSLRNFISNLNIRTWYLTMSKIIETCPKSRSFSLSTSCTENLEGDWSNYPSITHLVDFNYLLVTPIFTFRYQVYKMFSFWQTCKHLLLCYWL